MSYRSIYVYIGPLLLLQVNLSSGPQPRRHRGISKQVKFIFSSIKVTPCEPESNTADKSQYGHDAIVPNEEGIFRERDQGLTDSRREGGLKEVDAHDEATHVLGSLRSELADCSGLDLDLKVSCLLWEDLPC